MLRCGVIVCHPSPHRWRHRLPPGREPALLADVVHGDPMAWLRGRSNQTVCERDESCSLCRHSMAMHLGPLRSATRCAVRIYEEDYDLRVEADMCSRSIPPDC